MRRIRVKWLALSSPILEGDISAPGYLMNIIIGSANSKYEAPACAKPLRRRQAKFETTPNVQNTNVPNKHFLKFGILDCFGFRNSDFVFPPDKRGDGGGGDCDMDHGSPRKGQK